MPTPKPAEENGYDNHWVNPNDFDNILDSTYTDNKGDGEVKAGEDYKPLPEQNN